MGTDRLRTPCPPDALLSAYEVETDTGWAPGVTAAQRVAGLTVLDGHLCTALSGAALSGVPGELLVIDHAARQGPGFRGTGVRGAAHRVPLRRPPVALTAVTTDVGRRVFVLAEGGGEVVPIDLLGDAQRARPRAEIALEPAPHRARRPAPRSGGVRAAPSMAAHSVLGRVYISDPDARRIAAIDTHRLVALPGEVIDLPARPGRMVVDEQDATLFVLLASQARPDIAVVDLVTGEVDVIALSGAGPGSRPGIGSGIEWVRDIAYDNGSGLIFVGNAAEGSTAPGVLALDRDTGRALGGPIRTGDAPTALAVMRAPGATLVFCCAATATGRRSRVEVIDVAHRAVVGSVPVPDGSDLLAVDQQIGDVFVAASATGRITRLVLLIGGTPIARHPAVACAGAGPALGGPRRTPDGTGWLQPFCRGTAVATADIGTVLIDADHAADWLTGETTLGRADAGAGGRAAIRLGTDAADRLGNPVADTMALAGHRVTYFERGLVVTGPDREQVVRVAGPVYPRYRELDDVAGPLGPPVRPAVSRPTGPVQQAFTGGHIVHHPEYGTHVLQAAGEVNPGASDRPDRTSIALDLVGPPSSGAGFGNSAVILLTGDAGVVQVTDEGGHRLPAAATVMAEVAEVAVVSEAAVAVMTGNGRPAHRTESRAC